MKVVLRALAFFLVFTVVAVSGGVFVVNAIRRPINESVDHYTAQFTDVSGLRVGNDVRLLGVPVGKVDGITLEQSGDRAATAKVSFTLARNQHLYGDSVLAIRYLNLTGIRYLDVQQPTTTGRPREPGTHLTIDSTSPSFDITRVFRGLAPVFATMQPDDINHLFASLLALVQGDTTSGLSGTIASLTKALQFFDDRKAIIDTLITNLTEVSESINGRSEFLEPVFRYLSDLASSLVDNTQQLRLLADSSGEVLNSADYLLAAIGLRPNQTPDLDAAVRQIIPAARSILDVLALTPGILTAVNNALPPGPGAQTERSCSKGVAQLPDDVSVFLQGAEVTLCRR